MLRLKRNYSIAVLAVLLGILVHPPKAFGYVPYTARIEGVADATLLGLLTSVSDSIALQAEPPSSALQLRRRAEKDLERLKEVCQSQGFYGAHVDFVLDTESSPASVVFQVDLKLLYPLGPVTIEAEQGANIPPELLPEPQEAGLQEGQPALAATIAAADARILTHLRERGYPGARIANRDVLVRHDSINVEVTYSVTPGPRVRFGELQLQGLEKVKPQVVEDLTPWEPDDWYDERDVAELRERIYGTGLFSTTQIQPQVGAQEDGSIAPILIDVQERLHRTASVGLEYKTDEGAGVDFQWQHRNMYGLGHRLTIDSTLATEERSLRVRYRIDRFRRMDQALNVLTEVVQEEREAYDSDRIRALVNLERNLAENTTGSVGVGLRIGRTEQAGQSDSHQLIYFPVLSTWDRTDDTLNPTQGYKLAAHVEPYVGADSLFIKGDVTFSFYLRLGEWETKDGRSLDDWVLAMRAKVGGIAGEELIGIPSDIRYYAGGGGSIRGYEYQTVSPLLGNTPIGGRSVAEVGVEIRKRITEDFGVAAFVDGGSAFESPWPDFSSDVLFGAGVGLRYFTPLGPMRLDIAVPLDRRSGLDDSYQIYLSIGQSF